MIAYIRFILGMVPAVILGWLILETCSFKGDLITKLVLSFGAGMGATTYLMLVLGLSGKHLYWWTTFLFQMTICAILLIYLRRKDEVEGTKLTVGKPPPLVSFSLSSKSFSFTRLASRQIDKLKSLTQTELLMFLVIAISSLLVLYQTAFFPAIGWDVYSYWYPRARVFFEHNQILCMPPITEYELSLHWHTNAETPLFVLSLAYTFFQIGGVDIIVSHLLNGIFGLGVLLLVYMLAKEMFGQRVAFFSVFLTSCSSLWYFQSIQVTGDVVFAFYALSTIYLFYRFIKNSSWSNALTAGIFVGMMGLTKPQSILVFVGILFYCVFVLRSKMSLAMLSVASAPLLAWYGRIHFLFGDAPIREGIGSTISGGVVRRIFEYFLCSGKYTAFFDSNYRLAPFSRVAIEVEQPFLANLCSVTNNLLFSQVNRISIPVFVLIIIGAIICFHKFEGKLLLYFSFLFLPTLLFYVGSDSTRYILTSILLLIILGANSLDWVLMKIGKKESYFLVSTVGFFAISNVLSITMYGVMEFYHGIHFVIGILVFYVLVFTFFVGLPTIQKLLILLLKSKILLTSIMLVSILLAPIIGSMIPLQGKIYDLAYLSKVGLLSLSRISEYGYVFYRPFADLDAKLDEDNPFTRHLIGGAQYLNQHPFNGTFLCCDIGIVFFLDPPLRERSVYLYYVYDKIHNASDVLEYFRSIDLDYIQFDLRQINDEKLNFIYHSEHFEKVFEEDYYGRTIWRLID